MSQQKSANREFYADGDVLVCEFPEGTELTGAENDKMAEEFGALPERSHTNASVTVLRSDEPYFREDQEDLRQSALASDAESPS